MGVVYRAEHEDTREAVALKVVRVVEESLLASFRREVFALRNLSHPAVVRIVDDGVTDGQPWYVMPLLEGRTLGHYIDETHGESSASPSLPGRSTQLSPLQLSPSESPSSPPSGDRLEAVGGLVDLANMRTLPPPSQERPRVPQLERTLGLMRALCEPLAFVHGQGLVHRDLKPDNVLIGDDGRPVLLDFGLALRFAGSVAGRDVLEVAGSALGTPPYMAPEQIRGDLVDARADLYALGCMMYECLTGTPPFTGTPAGVLNKHLVEMPFPPSEHVAGIPVDLDALVMRLLEKEARDRFGYAVDVAAALRALGASAVAALDAPPAQPYLYRPSLVGRRRVLEDLTPELLPGLQGQGRIVLVGGLSGVGKTRLAMELATGATRRGMRVITGECQDVQGSTSGMSVRTAPLHPFRPLLVAIADRCRTMGADETARLLDGHGAVLAPYEPSISRLIGDQPPPAELPAEAARLRVADALMTVVARYAETQATFLVIDDLQWADELSLTVLQRLDSDYLESSNLVVVATFRSEERGARLDALLHADHVHPVELAPLGRAAVAAMVGEMLALQRPPEALVDFLMEESEGNPFFIAEYLRVAIGERMLRRDQTGVWSMHAEEETPAALRAALPLPGGMRDLVRRRFGQLGRDARLLVQVAAVIGREIDADVLLDAAGLGRGSAAALQELRAREILEEAERGDLRFGHDKVREVVYDEIPRAERPALHLSVARAIEARHGRGPDAALHFAVLAHHYGHTAADDKTLEYLEKAGEHALRAATSADARRFFERALRLAAEGRARGMAEIGPGRQARWQRLLGEACYNLGDLASAREHLQRCLQSLQPAGAGLLSASDQARSLWSSLRGLAAQARRLVGAVPRPGPAGRARERLREASLAAERLAQVHFFLNERGPAFTTGLECARIAEQLGPSPELARAYATLGVAMGFSPVPALAEFHGRRAQDIAEQVDDPRASAFVAFLRGLHAVNQGNHADARGYLGHALSLAREVGDERAAQEISANLGHAHNMAGQRSEALALYAELLESARRTHNVQAVLWAQNGRGNTLAFMGRAAEATAIYDEILPMARASGDATEILSEGFAALPYMLTGDWDRALAVADDVLALAHIPPTGWHCYLGYLAACEVLLAAWERELEQGRTPSTELRSKARRSCQAMRRCARTFRLSRPHALCYDGQLSWLEGSPRAARRAWARSRSLSIHLAMAHSEARATYELGRHRAAADPRRAVELDRAEQIFAAVGDWGATQVVANSRR